MGSQLGSAPPGISGLYTLDICARKRSFFPSHDHALRPLKILCRNPSAKLTLILSRFCRGLRNRHSLHRSISIKRADRVEKARFQELRYFHEKAAKPKIGGRPSPRSVELLLDRLGSKLADPSAEIFHHACTAENHPEFGPNPSFSTQSARTGNSLRKARTSELG